MKKDFNPFALEKNRSFQRCHLLIIISTILPIFLLNRGLTLFYECDCNVISGNTTMSIAREAVIIDQCDGNLLFSDNVFSTGCLPAVDTGINTWEYTRPVSSCLVSKAI